jgi:hypothetical protein
VALVARQLATSPRCTGEWGWRQRNGEKQQGGASELSFDDSLRTMKIRAAGAHGGDARSVGGGCQSAQAARLASQPGAVRVQERLVAGGLVGPGLLQ